jgi:small subunit ribosomal protein S16
MGDKKSPFYRIVVMDSRKARDGSYIDLIGTYDPLKVPASVKIDAEKAQYWISKGVQPTDTTRALLVQQGILQSKPVPKKGTKTQPPAPKPKKEEAPAAAEAPAEA